MIMAANKERPTLEIPVVAASGKKNSICGIGFFIPGTFHQNVNEVLAAAKVDIKPGAKPALPVMDSAIKAPIIAIKTRKPISETPFKII
jgi:hypothetical protein